MAKKGVNNLEQSLEQLEEVIGQLEDDDMTLEETFELYKKGMKLIQTCNKSIDGIEKKLITLMNKDEEEEEVENAF